jgi:hypothetical protein
MVTPRSIGARRSALGKSLDAEDAEDRIRGAWNCHYRAPRSAEDC